MLDTTTTTETSSIDVVNMRSRLAELLAEARARTFELLAPLGVEELFIQQDPLMSPIVWDIGHIGNFEELWGVRRFGDAVHPEYDSMYDAMTVPRAIRDKLPLPAYDLVQEYLVEVRTALLRALDGADLQGGERLLRDGYLYQMLLQHEYQHNETIIATMQLKQGDRYHPQRRRELPPGSDLPTGMVLVPEGEFMMGTNDQSVAYDNERSAHPVWVDAFQIDVAPVTNGEYLAFVNDGGYRNKELWAEAGWTFINDNAITAPKHWELESDGSYSTRSMDYTEPLNLRRPVVHVCWYEADAYARWVGKRLPTEPEWEKAAAWNPLTGESLLYPWGTEPPTHARANLDQRAWMAAEVGAYPAGVSPVGCHQMIGDVWEWTASDFAPYPGFEAFPYDEYSKVFFGPDYKVLRGGSWATRPGAVRNTFRNWDYPIRRQIFSGFRCAVSTPLSSM